MTRENGLENLAQHFAAAVVGGFSTGGSEIAKGGFCNKRKDINCKDANSNCSFDISKLVAYVLLENFSYVVTLKTKLFTIHSYK